MSDRKKSNLCIITFLAIISLIFGALFITTNCYDNDCNTIKFNGFVNTTKITKKTCTKNKSRKQVKYDCYSAYVYALSQYNNTNIYNDTNIINNNEYCILKTASDVSERKAIGSCKGYEIGTVVNWYKTKDNTQCHTSVENSNKFMFTMIGVALLSFSGLVFMCISIDALYIFFIKKQYQNVVATEPIIL